MEIPYLDMRKAHDIIRGQLRRILGWGGLGILLATAAMTVAVSTVTDSLLLTLLGLFGTLLGLSFVLGVLAFIFLAVSVSRLIMYRVSALEVVFGIKDDLPAELFE